MAEPILARMLLDAFRSMDREVEEALRDRGVGELRPSQAAALLLVDRKGGTRLTELAQRADMTRQAMMQLVDQLQGLGCVRRTADPDDGRAKIVRLTAKGLRHRAEARRALAAVEARARRELGDRRYEALKVLLGQLSSPEE
jgi:DNA-binding MarR family transcriptional regulator